MRTREAVIYGAGNIGRGFIGQLLFETGYHTAFIDVNDGLVAELNRRGEYPLRIFADDSYIDIKISRISAVNIFSEAQVSEAVAAADLMATAVGANNLAHIAGSIADGLSLRYLRGGAALDILVCENLMRAGAYLKGLVRALLPQEIHSWFDASIGFVDTSIGRMVPLQTLELQDGDPMRVCVEAYAKLPADKDAFKAGTPKLKGIVPYSPFSFYAERKLYIHNMGHALAAYCGSYLGCEYIWQAVETPIVSDIVRKAMMSSADALAARYQADGRELHAYVDDLLRRFANRQLGDTVYRVGRDLRRKLATGDRMSGALRACLSEGTDTSGILLGIALSMSFPEDLNMPPQKVLTDICGIGENEAVYHSILSIYRRACDGGGLAEMWRIAKDDEMLSFRLK